MTFLKKLGKFFLILGTILHCVALEGKVYDCFPFFNELELLHLRLEELYGVVDHFVIVESSTSFTGRSKPLYFQENQEQFAKYKDKIIHIVIDHFPHLTGNAEKDHWYRESYSRDAILWGLQNCNDDDVIFISDLDEIPRAGAILEVANYLLQSANLSLKQRQKIPVNKLVCGLDMRLFMFLMNRESFAGWYAGSKGAPYWFVKSQTPWGIKLFHHHHALHKINNAGWHFHAMGGMERALEKWLNTGPIYFEGFEETLERYKNNPDQLENSFYSQVSTRTVKVPIDDSFPRYFLNNIEYFRKLGWLDEETDN
jgi:beta-1,4-mannosyl-glycoprotein beta-1,4-N-acetylglucosaminyltransferase